MLGSQVDSAMKDIFGSDEEYQYSLTYEYDDKGNLKSETDSIGRKAEYRYDNNDNKTNRARYPGDSL